MKQHREANEIEFEINRLNDALKGIIEEMRRSSPDHRQTDYHSVITYNRPSIAGGASTSKGPLHISI